jgi:hypothetical protein
MASWVGGEFLSSKSQREIALARIAEEREKVAGRRREVQAELAYMLGEDGLPEADAAQVAATIAGHPEVLRNSKVEEAFGIAVEGAHGSPLQGAVVMGIAFGLGALAPILPYLLLPLGMAVYVSFLATAGVLFAIGVAKTRWTRANPLGSASGSPSIVTRGIQPRNPSGRGIFMPATVLEERSCCRSSKCRLYRLCATPSIRRASAADVLATTAARSASAAARFAFAAARSAFAAARSASRAWSWAPAIARSADRHRSNRSRVPSSGARSGIAVLLYRPGPRSVERGGQYAPNGAQARGSLRHPVGRWPLRRGDPDNAPGGTFPTRPYAPLERE